MDNVCLSGRVWKFGHHIDSGQMAIGQYTRQSVEVYASHCLENICPEFAKSVHPGDIIVAGDNFGAGSSRETAVRALRYLGVSAVVATFFSRIFFRNAVNLGLPVMESAEADSIANGDHVDVYPLMGRIYNRTQGIELKASVLPDHMMAIIQAGGLFPYLQQHLTESHNPFTGGQTHE